MICSYCSFSLGWKQKLMQISDNSSITLGQSPARLKMHFATTSGLVLMKSERLSACSQIHVAAKPFE